MLLTFRLDEQQDAIGDSVKRFCQRSLGATPQERQKIEFSPNLWRALAELGVFALGAPGEDATGGFLDLVVAAEHLGRAGFPGPLPATILATGALPAAEVEAVLAGTSLVSFGRPPLMPWGMAGDISLGLIDGRVKRLDITSRTPAETLGGEGWAQVEAKAGADLGAFADLRHRYDLPLGALMVGAGLAMVESAAEHAANRRQFGQIIGTFQGVAFPLAEAVVALESAQLLLRAAALRLDEGAADGPKLALAARLSAGRAARKASFTAHQSYGALGATREGPVFWLSRRVAQWSVQTPSDRESMDDLPLELPSILDTQQVETAS